MAVNVGEQAPGGRWRGFLGSLIALATAACAATFSAGGLVVTEAEPGASAARAGIRVRDRAPGHSLRLSATSSSRPLPTPLTPDSRDGDGDTLS